MSMVGQSRSLEIFICLPKMREPVAIRLTFLFSHWNRKGKTDDPVTVSFLALPQHTHFAPPHPSVIKNCETVRSHYKNSYP